MPTISQLPATSHVTAADQIPISQAGSVRAVNVGTLLAGTQPAIMIATGNLFGRASLGPGGPDPIGVGTGLSLNAATLVATGADHATFAVEGSITLTDQAVVNSSGSPKLLPLPLLRGLFSAGANIAIDQNGTISATDPGGILSAPSNCSISVLPTVGTISAGDLVAISQSGTDHTISYANFINGQTIDEVQAAGPVSNTDTFLVAQNGNIMARQTFAAIWAWLNANLSGYQTPTVELTSNTTLSAAAHNGHLLICSQPITVTPSSAAMGNGFSCALINLSSGVVSLGTGITTSSGTDGLSVGQAATLTCVTYSGGTVVYAWISGTSAALGLPAQVTGVAVGTVTSSSVALSWSTLSPSPTNYTVQYRISGTSAWSDAPSVTVQECMVGGLLSATSYDFAVFAVNAAGAGSASAIVTSTTSETLTPPGQVTGLVASNPTANTISLTWSAPSSGGAVSNYTLQDRVSGTTSWSTAASGVSTTSFTVTGLSSATSYDFAVLAMNSAGPGAASTTATASTIAAVNSVTSITWNIVPSGSYTHGSGAIGVNAQISPSTAPVQFGFSTSLAVPPTTWTAGTFVNSNLWGAYVNTPAAAGAYYAWAEGMDGSSPTAYPTAFSVT